MGTIIIWIVAMWLLAGSWGAYHIYNNTIYRKYANEFVLTTEDTNEQDLVFYWTISCITFTISGPWAANRAIRLSNLTEEEIKDFWEIKEK